MNIHLNMAPVTILSLEVETLANIFEYVDDESPRTTRTVTRVCKSFHFAVQLVLHRHKILEWDSKNSNWVLSQARVSGSGQTTDVWKTPDSLRGLRHLTIRRREESPDSDFLVNPDVYVRPLQSILADTSSLKTLNWDIGLLPPVEVVKTLQQYHPKAELKISRRVSNIPNNATSLEQVQALADSPCLTAFSLATSRSSQGTDLSGFQKIVAGAPNLRFASLVDSFHGVVSRQDDTTDQTSVVPSSALRHLTIDGWSLSAETLDHWSKYVNLATLESFKCSRGRLSRTYFQQAAQKLTSLKRLSLNLSERDIDEATTKAIEDYFSACSPLQSLSLWSWNGKVQLSTILDRHGPTLTDLHLHEREDDVFVYGEEKLLSMEDLKGIRNACPQLKAFTFDLPRVSAPMKAEDYVAIWKELEEFKLDKLQVYFDGGMRCLSYLMADSDWHGDETVDAEGSDDNSMVNQPTHIRFSELSGPGECCNELLPGNMESCTTDYFSDTGVMQTLFPPPLDPEFCLFAAEAWKAVFGSHTTGPRVLDVKVGEWERKLSAHVAEQRDIRRWCRVKPNERDDLQGECTGLSQCCSGHTRRFSSCFEHETELETD